MNEKLQQLQQTQGELSFVISHHERLVKDFTRQLFNVELAIQQEQNALNEVKLPADTFDGSDNIDLKIAVDN